MIGPTTRCLMLATAVLAPVSGWAAEGRVVSKTTGQPIADAEVAILGRAGSVRTDAEGRFRWTPDPRPPFEVLIVLPGGGYVKPILVEQLTGEPLVLEVAPALEESVMVVAGAAPSVEAAPANGVDPGPGRGPARPPARATSRRRSRTSRARRRSPKDRPPYPSCADWLPAARSSCWTGRG